MNGFRVGHFGCRNDGRHVQVTQRGWRRSDADGLLGQFDVFGVAIGFGINHDGLDAEFTAGALNPQGNFASIGDQDFFEHRCWVLALFDDEQGLTIFNRLSIDTEDLCHDA